MAQKIKLNLADLRDDTPSDIPQKLLIDWEQSQKTSLDQKRLLTPYTKTGYLVSTDSSGLSKLSISKGLLETIQLIHIPKKIIYSSLLAIGGQAVGKWVADNTQTYFPKDTPPKAILETLKEINIRNSKNLVKVGASVGYGTFTQIGSGMFGHSASQIEHLAENVAKPNQVITSSSFDKVLKNSKTVKFTISNFQSNDQIFPHNYDVEFVNMLDRWYKNRSVSLEKKIFKDYLKLGVVVYVFDMSPQPRLLLEKLSRHFALSNLIQSIQVSHRNLKYIKSTGHSFILIASDGQSAIDYASQLFSLSKNYSIKLRVSLVKGDYLLFRTPDIVGNPVNLAAKLAEDSDLGSGVVVHSSVNPPPTGESFNVNISGVSMEGKLIRV